MFYTSILLVKAKLVEKLVLILGMDCDISNYYIVHNHAGEMGNLTYGLMSNDIFAFEILIYYNNYIIICIGLVIHNKQTTDLIRIL